MSEKKIPLDFPRYQIAATVSGVQPKILVRKVGDQYVQGLTDDEMLERYDACEDLAQQLAPYTMKKMRENPDWSLEDAVLKIELGVWGKVNAGTWDLTGAEVAWIMTRVKLLMRTDD